MPRIGKCTLSFYQIYINSAVETGLAVCTFYIWNVFVFDIYQYLYLLTLALGCLLIDEFVKNMGTVRLHEAEIVKIFKGINEWTFGYRNTRNRAKKLIQARIVQKKMSCFLHFGAALIFLNTNFLFFFCKSNTRELTCRFYAHGYRSPPTPASALTSYTHRMTTLKNFEKRSNKVLACGGGPITTVVSGSLPPLVAPTQPSD